jgi:ABC-type transport system substrate-binding protein
VLYGINRDVVLNRVLLSGRTQEGSQVVSGPFPASASIDDPAGYGADNRIQPVPYEPRLAIALQAMATKEVNPKAKAEEPARQKQRPILIAHSNDPVHRLACAAIAEQLKRTGMLIELVEYKVAKGGLPKDYDLQYVELAAWEPVVDARRLLGEQGITGHGNAYLSLALAKLDRAETWKEIRRRLGEVHRLVADELVVIPLYQTVNHYAFRRDAVKLGTSVVTLYEDVESWKQKHDPSQAAR